MIRQLRTFCVAVEEGSFHRAADRLYMSQPSVSQHIANLERYYGVAFFDRSGRSVRLTSDGKGFYRIAREIISQFDDIPSQLQTARNLAVGKVEIGATVAVTSYYLPEVIARYSSAHPDITLNVTTGDRIELSHKVATGDLDLLLAERDLLNRAEQDLVFLDVWKEPIIIVSSPWIAMNLEKQGDFSKCRFIGFNKSCLYRPMIDDFLVRQNISPVFSVKVDSPVMACELARKSVGIALTSPSIAKEFLKRGDLVSLGTSVPIDQFWEVQLGYSEFHGLGHAGWRFLKTIH